MSRPIAPITGITGQDGSYLAELLLPKGYEVHGTLRRASHFNTARIEHLYLDDRVRDQGQRHKIEFHWADMTDSSLLIRIIQGMRPTKIYNLAARSHIKVSPNVPKYAGGVIAIGTLRLFEAVRMLGMSQSVRIYQASTSELYDHVAETPQNELTPFRPCSPHVCVKFYAYWIARSYRESYGMFVVNGILFNHESERRGENSVTRKITMAVVRIKSGLQDKLYLGNFDAFRDRGYAPDYVYCVWLILQNEKPEDSVAITGEQRSVRESATLAFRHVGIGLEWRGERFHEEGVDRAMGRVLVAVDESLFRPAGVEALLGDSMKARQLLGWSPQMTPSEELIKRMVENDLELFVQEECKKL